MHTLAVLLLKAISLLAPSLPEETAKTYAGLIAYEATWYKTDPIVIVALINIESEWKVDKRSKTHDFGLGQVHVSRTTNAMLLGHESLLFSPAFNIRQSARTVGMWERYHNTRCADRSRHPYWAHYKYGYIVKKDISHALKVQATVDWLRTVLGIGSRNLLENAGSARRESTRMLQATSHLGLDPRSDRVQNLQLWRSTSCSKLARTARFETCTAKSFLGSDTKSPQATTDVPGCSTSHFGFWIVEHISQFSGNPVNVKTYMYADFGVDARVDPCPT
jgi:hypothetical protein